MEFTMVELILSFGLVTVVNVIINVIVSPSQKKFDNLQNNLIAHIDRKTEQHRAENKADNERTRDENKADNERTRAELKSDIRDLNQKLDNFIRVILSAFLPYWKRDHEDSEATDYTHSVAENSPEYSTTTRRHQAKEMQKN